MTKMLTLQQASERTNLSIASIRMRIFRKEFPFSKIGNRVFVDETELEKYLQLSQHVSTAEAAARSEERCSL